MKFNEKIENPSGDNPHLTYRLGCGISGTPAQTNIFCGRRFNGKSWLTMIIQEGGMGASSKMDSHHCAIFPANGANAPVEIFESDTPLIVQQRSLLWDSGGPGKMRGGLGRKFVICPG